MRTNGLLAVACGLLATTAWAGPQFPYQGRLDLSGTPVTGPYALSFIVYNAPSGGSVVWGPEVFPSVPVVGGAFSVKLGSIVSIDPAKLLNGPLYVAVAVQGKNDSVPIALAGRQQLLHTPFASASQQDFAVQGRIGAGGANPGDAGVTITAAGAASNGSTVGVLQLSSTGGTLVADGQGIDSSASLQLQGHTRLPTAVGGLLSTNGAAPVGTVPISASVVSTNQVVAPNTWTKIYDSGGAVTAWYQSPVSIPVSGLDQAGNGKMFKIYFVGSFSPPGGADCRLYAQPNGATSGYNDWYYANGAGEYDNSAFLLARSANYLATHITGEWIIFSEPNVAVRAQGQSVLYNPSPPALYNWSGGAELSTLMGNQVTSLILTSQNPSPCGFNGHIVVYQSAL